MRSDMALMLLFLLFRYGYEIYQHANHWRKAGAKDSWRFYTPGSFAKCSKPGHHSCLDQFKADGNLQFTTFQLWLQYLGLGKLISILPIKTSDFLLSLWLSNLSAVCPLCSVLVFMLMCRQNRLLTEWTKAARCDKLLNVLKSFYLVVNDLLFILLWRQLLF